MCFECCGGDTSADGIGNTIAFALNMDNPQIETQVFLSHGENFCWSSRESVGGREFCVPADGRCVITTTLKNRLPVEFHVLVFEGCCSGEEINY